MMILYLLTKGGGLMKKFLQYICSTICGAAMIGFCGFVFGHSFEFILDLICSPKATTPETETYVALEATAEPTPTKVILDCLPNSEPVYEDQIYIPEPFYYDEYGALYYLVEGTIDEYYMSEDYVEVVETPESTAFEEISYYHFQNTLFVVFRTSGAYIYYDVEPEVWDQFKRADSKGGFFNEVIKGNYEYDRD